MSAPLTPTVVLSPVPNHDHDSHTTQAEAQYRSDPVDETILPGTVYYENLGKILFF